MTRKSKYSGRKLLLDSLPAAISPHRTRISHCSQKDTLAKIAKATPLMLFFSGHVVLLDFRSKPPIPWQGASPNAWKD